MIKTKIEDDDNSNKKMICDGCQKTFVNKSSLVAHKTKKDVKEIIFF